MTTTKFLKPLMVTTSVLWFMMALPAHAAKKWRVYENCTLIENKANDGDSFHVKVNKRKYLFRLYWVDCPETDNSVPDRNAVQAEHFGITPPEVIKYGKEAAKFARDFMKDGFTVHTKFADALGRSAKDRDYAIIEKNGTFLHIELVRAGLARVHGFQEVSDNMPSLATMRLRIKGADAEARREKRGAWAAGKNPTGPTLPDSVTLTRTITILDPDNSSRTLGLLRPGAVVDILGAETPTLIRIQFKAGEETMDGLCNRSELGI